MNDQPDSILLEIFAWIDGYDWVLKSVCRRFRQLVRVHKDARAFDLTGDQSEFSIWFDAGLTRNLNPSQFVKN